MKLVGFYKPSYIPGYRQSSFYKEIVLMHVPIQHPLSFLSVDAVTHSFLRGPRRQNSSVKITGIRKVSKVFNLTPQLFLQM